MATKAMLEYVNELSASIRFKDQAAHLLSQAAIIDAELERMKATFSLDEHRRMARLLSYMDDPNCSYQEFADAVAQDDRRHGSEETREA